MIIRKTYTKILIALIAFLSSCQTFNFTERKSNNISYTEPVPDLTAYDIPLPSTDFSFIMPEAKLAKQTMPKATMNFNFSAYERSEVAAKDPYLMKGKSSLLVDLRLITEEEYSFPLPKAKLISDYAGRRKHHSGVDLKTFANDTIVAAFDGVVRLAKAYYGYGNIVVIRHHNGMETLYSHNSKNLVKPGDTVKAGQPIGLVGRTGRATTDHLHFEVRVNGQHINPNHVFDMNNHKLNDHCLLFTQGKNGISTSQINLPIMHMADTHTYTTLPDEL